MILIFGGTTEGRVAVDVCEQAAKCYLYSTRSGEQRLALSYGEELSGDMCQCDMVELAKLRDVDLIIDAAHPYASGLHHNLTSAAAELSIPVIRFERESQPATYPGVVMLDSMDDAVEYISSHSLHGVLALTGVKSAQFLTPISRRCGVVLRIMDREESNWEVERTSFPKENIIYYDFDNTHSLKDLCRELRITSILTKESGEAGGYGKKVAVAQELDIPLLVIKRPELPQYQSAVFGPHSLRRSIEELLPTYFGLRTGFTSGSAATAATTAALMAGVCSVEANSVEIYLPSGEPITLPVAYAKTDNCLFEACVIKDGGDDPDATHNLEFISRVSLAPCCGEESEVRIVGGEGVGVVTLHGLGIEVGQHAINPVPRQMITDNVLRFLARRSLKCIVEVEISVPRGAEVAPKTFNPRLGITGGISILGTSGIVQPFSSEAFLQSIHQQIRVAKASSCPTIVINSGAMSERFVKAHYPCYPAQNYIHYGNLIGATISLAASEQIEHIILGVMIGKAVKLAAGALDTHSKRVVLNHDFLVQLSREAGCSESTQQQISEITTARQLWGIVPPEESLFYDLIAQNCYRHCKPLMPNGSLELLLLGESGELVSRVGS